jgi:hypothetical protein
LDEGVAAIETCYQLASDQRLLTAQYRAASHLAGVLRDAGRVEDSLKWHQKAWVAFDQLGGQEKLASFFSNCAQFAMAVADFSVAKEWVSRALRELPSAQVGHAGLHFRALELRIKQITESYDCTEHELQELLDVHLRHRAFGHHDEVMEAVWYALARKGRETEGDKLLHQYLRQYRRLRWPVTQGLATLVANRRAERRSADAKQFCLSETGVRARATSRGERNATAVSRCEPAMDRTSSILSNRGAPRGRDDGKCG